MVLMVYLLIFKVNTGMPSRIWSSLNVFAGYNKPGVAAITPTRFQLKNIFIAY